MSFSELRCKDVINVCDGRKLGKPIDLHFSVVNACVEALVVPGPANLWAAIKGEREGYTIPWSRIRRIGDDVILVELGPDFFKC
jgi:YlmC/YmxH family sporulation protein